VAPLESGRVVASDWARRMKFRPSLSVFTYYLTLSVRKVKIIPVKLPFQNLRFRPIRIHVYQSIWPMRALCTERLHQSRRRTFRSHLMAILGRRPFRCEDCKLRFYATVSLEIAKIRQTQFRDGELQFLTTCKECGTEFYGPMK
jgi:hypothetical protein